VENCIPTFFDDVDSICIGGGIISAIASFTVKKIIFKSRSLSKYTPLMEKIISEE